MIDKIDMACSGCGKVTHLPEYNDYGLPYEFLLCGCKEETKLNPRKLNSIAWEWAWMELIGTTRRELGDVVADRLVKYIIDKRNYHIKDRKYIHEDALEPQSLKKRLELTNKEEVIEATKEMGHLLREAKTRDRNEGFIPR